jgi:hypothetical protein
MGETTMTEMFYTGVADVHVRSQYEGDGSESIIHLAYPITLSTHSFGQIKMTWVGFLDKQRDSNAVLVILPSGEVYGGLIKQAKQEECEGTYTGWLLFLPENDDEDEFGDYATDD